MSQPELSDLEQWLAGPDIHREMPEADMTCYFGLKESADRPDI
jgi:hypothetical protein